MENVRQRLQILNTIRPLVGDNLDAGLVRDPVVFCIADGARLAGHRDARSAYEHAGHVYDRAFVFDPRVPWEFRGDGELRHLSVGAILWRAYGGEPRYCLLRRTTYPIGYYTIPAGHVDTGEEPLTSVLRETYEETGLAVIRAELLYAQEEIADACRRGANYHTWHLYLCECLGEPHLSDEGDVIGWYTRQEILENLPLTRPAAHFLGRYFDAVPRIVHAGDVTTAGIWST